MHATEKNSTPKLTFKHWQIQPGGPGGILRKGDILRKCDSPPAEIDKKKNTVIRE